MKAMVLTQLGSLDQQPRPLALMEIPRPVPGPGEVLVEVSACGVCHTELDEIEGRTAPPRLPVVPGHEVVGRIVGLGPGCGAYALEQRVGVGWIHSSTGKCDENLDEKFRATGRDVNGGYAEFLVVSENYAYPIPEVFSDVQAAPLLCAGAIGYRALKLTQLRNGESLGLMGFGGSAHLVLQLVRHQFPDSPIYVFARDGQARTFARSLGAVWAGETEEQAPQALHAIIDTTPAWGPIVAALGNLRPGGRLVINAIRKEDGDKQSLLRLNYGEHLWMEREIKSVANITGRDIREFLQIAGQIPLAPEVTTYRLEQANEALVELKRGPVRGAKVLIVGSAVSG